MFLLWAPGSSEFKYETREFIWLIPTWLLRSWSLEKPILAFDLFLFVTFGFPEACSPTGWSLDEAHGFHLFCEPRLTLNTPVKPGAPNEVYLFLIKLKEEV